MERNNTTYVIYDQFRWASPDHLEIPVKGWSEALKVYGYQKSCHPDAVLGLCTMEEFKKLKPK